MKAPIGVLEYSAIFWYSWITWTIGTGKDLSVTVMLYQQGVINANSRKLIESWESPFSNAKNPGDAKNIAKPKKPKQTQLRKTRNSAEETRAKLGIAV